MTEKSSGSDLHYQTHVFCCVNERAPDHPRSCCSARGSVELRDYMKTRAKELGIERIRVNSAGCLERCELGPAMVIYPEGTWYTYESRADIDEILDRHILGGERVDRLHLEAGLTVPKPKALETLSFTVERIDELTPDIKSFALVAPDGAELPPFDAGAHIDVISGDGLRRSYSLANDPAERHRYVLGVLREVESSGGSEWMHQAVAAGDSLTVVPPLNNFPLREDAEEHILIAGGIGITPILAMGYRLRSLNAKFTLHYCTKSGEETAFTEEVKDVFGANAVFHHDGGDPSNGIDLEAVLSEPPEGAHLYICGPRGLLNGAREAADHWPDNTVHFELFAPSDKIEQWENESFEISLSRRKMTLTVPPDKSILDVVRENGVIADSSCEQGICGTCRIRLLGGRAEHRDEVLTGEEKEKNSSIMICTSRAKAGEMLILDL